MRLWGTAPRSKKSRRMIDTVAKTDATVMIRGESGTGKELVAQRIHGKSNRRYFLLFPSTVGPFPKAYWKANSLAMKKVLLRAQYKRKGKLEMANGAPSS